MSMSANENILRYHMRLPKTLHRKAKSTFSKYNSNNLDLYNSEPIPYQREVFQPSTICKIINLPKRLITGFLENECMDNLPQRGIILHTERYNWSNAKETHKSQNERLIAEENYLKKVKYLKKMSENRFKLQNQNFILEGENVLPSMFSEKLDVTPASQTKMKIKIPPLTNNSEFNQPSHKILDASSTAENELMDSSGRQPYVAVQKIKLKNRISGSEVFPSALLQDHQNDNIKPFYNSLSPLPSIQRHGDVNEMKSISSVFYPSDHDDPEPHKEKSNKPIIRINEYKIGGITMKFTERADIQGEIRYLKSIILPTIAKELYVGRGIQLPSNHATKIPRGKYVESQFK